MPDGEILYRGVVGNAVTLTINDSTAHLQHILFITHGFVIRFTNVNIKGIIIKDLFSIHTVKFWLNYLYLTIRCSRKGFGDSVFKLYQQMVINFEFTRDRIILYRGNGKGDKMKISPDGQVANLDNIFRIITIL